MPPQPELSPMEKSLIHYITGLHEERFVNRVLLQWLLGNFIVYILVSLLVSLLDNPTDPIRWVKLKIVLVFFSSSVERDRSPSRFRVGNYGYLNVLPFQRAA